MARIRTIKPEFWNSPAMKVCRDPWARLLFVAMWNWADDTGRGIANPRELAGFAFPHDEEISSSDIRRMLGGIRRAFDVEFYEVGGREYYAIPSWDNHQKIDKRSGSKYPAPDEGTSYDPSPEGGSDQPVSGVLRVLPESSADSAESTPSPRRTPGAGTGEQGNRGRTTSSDKSDETDLFDEFWRHYPRKEAKVDARKAWRQVTKKTDAQMIIEGLTAYAFKPDRQFQPLPASWLRGQRWEDERPALRILPDRRLTPDELLNVLGPDRWTCPAPPAGMTSDEEWEWRRQQQIVHIEERQAEARARLAAGA